MYAFSDQLTAELTDIKDAGLWKAERELTSPQSAHVTTKKAEALNFCANNYLGLADDSRLIDSAKRALDERGFGMASVRFICGTQDLHLQLEEAMSRFLGTEATILFSSCFDANGGVFEVLFGAEDAIISDALNHASASKGRTLFEDVKNGRLIASYHVSDGESLEAKKRPVEEHSRLVGS